MIGGAGNVGKSIIRTLQGRKGIDIVAVVDSYPPLIGQDAGEVAGVGKIGVPITDSLEAAFALPEADVAISVTKPCTDREMYELVKSAIDHGLNVLVPNMATCNLWFSNPKLAEEIDVHCKEKGVSYDLRDIGHGFFRAAKYLESALQLLFAGISAKYGRGRFCSAIVKKKARAGLRCGNGAAFRQKKFAPSHSKKFSNMLYYP